MSSTSSSACSAPWSRSSCSWGCFAGSACARSTPSSGSSSRRHIGDRGVPRPPDRAAAAGGSRCPPTCSSSAPACCCWSSAFGAVTALGRRGTHPHVGRGARAIPDGGALDARLRPVPPRCLPSPSSGSRRPTHHGSLRSRRHRPALCGVRTGQPRSACGSDRPQEAAMLRTRSETVTPTRRRWTRVAGTRSSGSFTVYTLTISRTLDHRCLRGQLDLVAPRPHRLAVDRRDPHPGGRSSLDIICLPSSIRTNRHTSLREVPRGRGGQPPGVPGVGLAASPSFREPDGRLPHRRARSP